MAIIPSKVSTRISTSLKKFQTVLTNAKTKDINESDTVVIVTDILAELLGYDKYSEITSETAIKKTWCDLAIKFEGNIKFIIEVKAIGLELKSDHIRQCVNYGANMGVDWVILTNGWAWKVYKIIFGKPVGEELVYEFNLLALSPRKQNDLELLFYVSRESLGRSVLEDFRQQKQVLSRYFLGQVLLTEPIIDSIKRTLKKLVPEVKVDNEEIYESIKNEVIKREVVEGEKAEEAKKRIAKSFKTIARKASNEKV